MGTYVQSSRRDPESTPDVLKDLKKAGYAIWDEDGITDLGDAIRDALWTAVDEAHKAATGADIALEDYEVGSWRDVGYERVGDYETYGDAWQGVDCTGIAARVAGELEGVA